MNNRKELLFIASIFLIAGLCSFIPGVYFPNSKAVDPVKNFRIIGAEDIHTSNSDRISEDYYIFQSGYCYQVKEGFNHSDFYQGSITQIPTSAYWKYPISEVTTLHSLKRSKNGYISQLVIPTELSLPVVSIILNPDDFFSYERGIYVQGEQSDFVSSKLFYPFPWNKPGNYYNKENDGRRIHFSFYDVTGKVQIATYVNAEISGKATRCFPQKSLKLSSSKTIGAKKFTYDFFKENKNYETIILRNGGNDNTKSLFRDRLMQELMNSSGILTSSFQTCEVYLNGEYWGIHFLQNRMDDNFISEKFEVKEKNVTIVESWALDKGSELEFNQLMKVVKNQINGFEELSELIDMEDMAIFLAAEIFFANTDWPMNNLKMYKINDSKIDTKWRFALFDLDYGFGYTGDRAFELDMFEHLASGTDLFSKMFNRLMKNEKFKMLLKTELEKMLTEYCSVEKMKEKIAGLKDELMPSIGNHTSRWGNPGTLEEWESEVELLNDFAEKRGNTIKNHIEKYLN